ncbi:hypothetical protein N7540_001288 [Penicillium herquei]|nr:hypothetical protein N7540_001288 [Penicillium herquei]
MSVSEKTIIAIPDPAMVKMEPGSPTSSEVTLTDGAKDLEKTLSKSMGSIGSGSGQNRTDLEAQTVLPQKARFAQFRFAVLTIYRRLFSLVFLANVGVFVAVMLTDRKLVALVNATAANLLACGLARQPLVVNSIFFVVCSIPRSAPITLRRWAAQVYHYGGVHSGCGVASLIWYIGFVGLMSFQYWTPSPTSAPTVSISAAPVSVAYIILLLLLAITVVAHPTFRTKFHDYFELVHRFSGWLVVALFMVLLMLFAKEFSSAEQMSLGKFLVQLPAFWFLLITVVAIIQPWLMLRKVPVRAEKLSNHAVRLHFDYQQTSFGKGIQLAKHPLRDWHGFATFPDAMPSGTRGQPSFSTLVSKAGDWTSDSINQPPTHFWKRGVLIFGFAYAMRVFKRVIVVTTGSGIGPCLSFLGDDNRPVLRVMWQTRSPLKTYGSGVLRLVDQMDEHPIILDTDQLGRIDMVPIIARQFEEFGAEAVCVVSNPKLTGRIVHELEARGYPAFGPIFDS